MKIKKFSEFESDNVNEYNVTRNTVGKFEENRQRQEIINQMINIIKRGSLEQLKAWKSILGW